MSEGAERPSRRARKRGLEPGACRPTSCRTGFIRPAMRCGPACIPRSCRPQRLVERHLRSSHAGFRPVPGRAGTTISDSARAGPIRGGAGAEDERSRGAINPWSRTNPPWLCYRFARPCPRHLATPEPRRATGAGPGVGPGRRLQTGGRGARQPGHSGDTRCRRPRSGRARGEAGSTAGGVTICRQVEECHEQEPRDAPCLCVGSLDAK